LLLQAVVAVVGGPETVAAAELVDTAPLRVRQEVDHPLSLH
jgi:hypothetical protein